MLKSFLLSITWSMCSLVVFCQFSEQISSDRPGFSIGAITVGKNVYQIQTGALFTQNEFPPSYTSHYFNNETNVRVGVGEKLELNSSIFFQKFGKDIADIFTKKEDNNLRITGVNLGLRYRLLKEKGWIPDLSVQSNINMYRFAGTNIILVAGHSITKRFSFTTNIIYNVDAFYEYEIMKYTANVSGELNAKTSIFVEYFGGTNKNAANYFNSGVGYLISDDFQLDMSFGNMINPSAFFGSSEGRQLFLNLGLSYRISKRKA